MVEGVDLVQERHDQCTDEETWQAALQLDGHETVRAGVQRSTTKAEVTIDQRPMPPSDEQSTMLGKVPEIEAQVSAVAV